MRKISPAVSSHKIVIFNNIITICKELRQKSFLPQFSTKTLPSDEYLVGQGNNFYERMAHSKHQLCDHVVSQGDRQTGKYHGPGG